MISDVILADRTADLPWTAGRLVYTLMFSLAVWACLGGACLMVGSTGGIGVPNAAAFFVRLDVVLLASLVGAALAAAGVVYQAILRNPLAEPYLLGVSSGAMLASYLWQLPWLTHLLFDGRTGGGWLIGQQSAAFTGALVAIGIVFLLARRQGRLDPITLLLVGVIVNAINGSLFLLINAVVKDTATPGGPMAFMVGTIQTSLTTAQKASAAAVIAVGWFILLFLSGQLNVANLSDFEAAAMGVRVHLLRWIALAVASLITAAAVAISGPIGFIGLICPHLVRKFVGNDQRKLLPLSTALGAGLLAVADAGSRKLAGGTLDLLPVGVLTGLLGGPFFLFMLWQSRSRREIDGSS